MKTLNYIQLYYGGSYTEEFVDLSDEALVFKFDTGNFLYKEKNCWSYTIIILSKTNIEALDCICLGDWYIGIINNVYSEYKYNDFKDFPKLEFYVVEYNFTKIDMSLPVEQIEQDAICRISKFKGIDEFNIYFSCIQVKDFFTLKDTYCMEYNNFSTDIFFSHKSKIVYSERYKKLYKEFYNKVLTKITS